MAVTNSKTKYTANNKIIKSKLSDAKEIDRNEVERTRRNAVKSKPPTPTTRRGLAMRQLLKEAMVELLRNNSFSEIRLEDITNLAGVRVSLFYHYFQSKIDITQEVLSDLLHGFRTEVSERPKSENPLEAIHFANQRMVALYSANPGAIRCMIAMHEGDAYFAPMWRELTLEWNRKICSSIQRQFPNSFSSEAEFLAFTYALAGAADNFLFEYFVHENPALVQVCPTNQDVAEYLTILWYRTLYLANPISLMNERFGGFCEIGLDKLSGH
jgi:AcrR family transcriptional regulator